MKRPLIGIAVPFGLALVLSAGLIVKKIVVAHRVVSEAVERLPESLRPPPDVFFEIASCANHHGVSRAVARRLLERKQTVPQRPGFWAIRYSAWIVAVEQQSPDDIMGLYASIVRLRSRPENTQSVQSASESTDSKWSPEEMIEGVILDFYPSPSPSYRKQRETLRARCRKDAA